ncbi:hypothetical protein A7E78_11815 [Syntrophotalea acetylenivorans]|uniref:Uncharacterized protein n=1 Tax=Syntrophotalea acetylenivorans TaxID=1842532 RepID=A0A1L3GS29_9BACT|nr:hypothetical protein [Syntrophotalea acetylenivorans]APG28468.1 hypothetical protein A7E78_11815 [Syntrophotalea acetylenivorans]
MSNEKIKVRVTESDQVMSVQLIEKRPERIKVLLGEGDHSVRCELLPTPNGRAYAGTVMGREIVYERSRQEVEEDIAKFKATFRQHGR